MAGERVYSVNAMGAVPAQAVDLADVGLRERQDLQEWVITHPEILGSGIKIVTTEFDRWQTTSGDRQLDRLDVLGIDTDGHLVVAELKRDRAPDTVHMQSIKYAAMVSRFTESDLAASHQRFLSSRGESITEDEALEALIEHAGELDVETLRRPRIVMVAGSFTPTTTASVVWLSEMGLDVTLQQAQAYQVSSGELVITVSQFFPIPDVEEFTVSPMRAEVRSLEQRKRRTREKSTVTKLVAARALEDETLLTLRPTTEVTSDVRAAIEAWVAEDPRRGRATWRNNRSQPLKWHADGNYYRPTAIVSKILSSAAQVDRSTRGPSWWVTEDGVDLTQIAAQLPSPGFDWEPLHELLRELPAGRWTTYGDLAPLAGTAAQPVDNHLATCASCANAHRVLGRQGELSPSFRWTDPSRTETQQEVLEREGVTFEGGRADPALRLTTAELEALSD